MIPVIAKSNFDRQQQCIGTPFMMTPLLEEFGYLADNQDNVKSVLEGTYVPPESSCKYAKEFIETLKIPREVKELESIGLQITAEENKSG